MPQHERKEIWKIYFHYRAFCYTGFAIYISVMLYKEWQISRRTDIASTTIIIQDGVAPNDLSEYTWTGSSDGDVPSTNNTETPNDNTNNNTDTEE